MPVAMERALKRVAKKKGYKGDRADAFIFGSMRHSGWRPYSSEGWQANPENKKKKK